MTWFSILVSGIVTYFSRMAMVALIDRDMLSSKVKGIANFKPNSSGINEPNIIPLIVDNCQQNHNVTPVPRT